MPPWRHLAMSEDIFGCHNWGKGVTLAPSGRRPRMCLNISKIHNTGPTAKIYQLPTSMILRFGNPAFS